MSIEDVKLPPSVMPLPERTFRGHTLKALSVLRHSARSAFSPKPKATRLQFTAHKGNYLRLGQPDSLLNLVKGTTILPYYVDDLVGCSALTVLISDIIAFMLDYVRDGSAPRLGPRSLNSSPVPFIM